MENIKMLLSARPTVSSVYVVVSAEKLTKAEMEVDDL